MYLRVVRVQLGKHYDLKAADYALLRQLQYFLDLDDFFIRQAQLVEVVDIDIATTFLLEEVLDRRKEALLPDVLDLY